MCSCCKNLRPADLPTLTDYAYFSCISLCYYAVRQFLPQANSLFFLISFNYSRNLVSSNTCLHINVNLWVKNVKLIHHWHLEKAFFLQSSSQNLFPEGGTTFILFSRKWKTKFFQVSFTQIHLCHNSVFKLIHFCQSP